MYGKGDIEELGSEDLGYMPPKLEHLAPLNNHDDDPESRLVLGCVLCIGVCTVYWGVYCVLCIDQLSPGILSKFINFYIFLTGVLSFI